MDDDTLRRGQPTTHIAFDETAILLENAPALAFSILGEGDIENRSHASQTTQSAR